VRGFFSRAGGGAEENPNGFFRVEDERLLALDLMTETDAMVRGGEGRGCGDNA